MKRPVDGRLGESIRTRRKLIGMSQADLASGIGVTFQQVQKYETGLSAISRDRLSQICDIMHLPSDFFSSDSSGYVGKPVLSDEQATAEALTRFLASGEGRRLAQAFMRIADARLRTRVLDFIATLADDYGT